MEENTWNVFLRLWMTSGSKTWWHFCFWSKKKKYILLSGVYAERYHTYSFHKQSRALAGVRNPSLAWWFVTVLLCYWVVNLKEKIPLCFHLLRLEKGPPLVSLLLSWFITTRNPEARGEGWLRAGIAAPLLNTSVSDGFAYGKMGGKTWPLPAARLPFLRYLWEKMEAMLLRKKARISAGIISLVEIQRGEKKWVTLGYLWLEFFVSCAEKCYWKTWAQNH